jgi:hypothetical protein
MCIPLIFARQRLGKHVPVAINTRKNRRIVGRVVFYAVRVVSKESTRLVLPRTSCLVYHETHKIVYRADNLNNQQMSPTSAGPAVTGLATNLSP